MLLITHMQILEPVRDAELAQRLRQLAEEVVAGAFLLVVVVVVGGVAGRSSAP